MTAPIPVRVLRHKCPHCSKSYNRPGRTREHMARCWHNPDAHGCKTCVHFQPADEQCCGMPDVNECYTPWCSDVADRCRAGVSLAGRPQCTKCCGTGDTSGGLGVGVCPACGGAAREIKPGPIVHCEKWEASNADR